MNKSIDIAPHHQQEILNVLSNLLPGIGVWAFGSRINGTARKNSDLDLVVFSTPELSHYVHEVRETFDESNLPFRVDMLVWDELPENFQDNIKNEHVDLYGATIKSSGVG